LHIPDACWLSTRINHYYDRKNGVVIGKVHEGMMSAATFVHCNSAAALESVAHTHPGWPLVVTGHSMGGKHCRPLPIRMPFTPCPCSLHHFALPWLSLATPWGVKYLVLSRHVLVVSTGSKICCVKQSLAPHVLVMPTAIKPCCIRLSAEGNQCCLVLKSVTAFLCLK